MWRELRLALEAAVHKWMVAEVEVGAFLSGGLDSSIIAALAARAADWPLKTFSVGTAGSPDIDAARAVARHIGSDHHELTFTADDLAKVLPKVIYHLESADLDLVRSALPTHFATTLARRHVKAILTGEGRTSYSRATPTIILTPGSRARWPMSSHVRSGPCTTSICSAWIGSPWPEG